MGRRIGLTGGIGSGKSTVAELWVECGAVLIDADALSRQLTAAGGAAIEPLREAFGPDMIGADGSLDRPRMRALAFADDSARRRLEAIVHPLVARERQRIEEAAGSRTCVYDIPLLAESGDAWRVRVDRILVVDCLADTQVSRVMQRSGLTPEEVRRIINAQASRAARRAIADAVLFNEGVDLNTLRQAVKALWTHWGCGTMNPS